MLHARWRRSVAGSRLLHVSPSRRGALFDTRVDSKVTPIAINLVTWCYVSVIRSRKVRLDQRYCFRRCASSAPHADHSACWSISRRHNVMCLLPLPDKYSARCSV